MSDNKNKRLQELGGSDFKIVDGEPNIKGWDVKDESGRKIGEVDELIFDTQSRKVRYIVVDLKGNVLDLDPKEVLVPIGIAQLNDKDDDVILPGVTADQLRALPDYDEDTLDTGVESKIRNVFGGLGAGALAAGSLTGNDRNNDRTTDDASSTPGTEDTDDFYNHHHFNDDKFYGSRKSGENNDEKIQVIKEDIEVGKEEVERGGIRLKQRIVEQQVEKDINLREEKVTVERTAVDRAADSSDLTEQEIEMREKTEVPVVNKEARVVEEVSLNKEVNERDEIVKDTVRNTEVDIEKLDKNSSTNKEQL